LSRLPERESEFDSDVDEEEEDDRRNEEDDEDEELDRQERQDEEDDEGVYSDDMTAGSSKSLTRIERLMTLPRQGQHGNGLPKQVAPVTHHVPLHSAHACLSRPGLPHGASTRGAAAALSAQTFV
jgi:hypothetical protein